MWKDRVRSLKVRFVFTSGEQIFPNCKMEHLGNDVIHSAGASSLTAVLSPPEMTVLDEVELADSEIVVNEECTEHF